MDSSQFKQLRGKLYFNHSLARYTSWRVGGRAECFYRPADLLDLQHFLAQLPDHEPITWLGLGSNVLIRDGGIAGTVILTLHGLTIIDRLDAVTLRVEAGVTCAKLAKYCVDAGFEAGAFFAGIPGTVGGALAMNAGAFGSETWDQVVLAETVDRKGQLYRRAPGEFNIQYRQVDGLGGHYFVAGHFRFPAGDSARAKQQIQQLLKHRNETQPIGQYSCGSVFRNPPGEYAARLIEVAGLKGVSMGDAEVSPKHANFILNKGAACAADIEKLINYVAERVHERTGIPLVREVHIIGKIAERNGP